MRTYRTYYFIRTGSNGANQSMIQNMVLGQFTGSKKKAKEVLQELGDNDSKFNCYNNQFLEIWSTSELKRNDPEAYKYLQDAEKFDCWDLIPEDYS